MSKIEDKILDILNKSQLDEAVEYEIIGGPTPSSILKAPLDYTRPVQKATVPQARPIPGVGQAGGSQQGEENEPITDVIDNLAGDENSAPVEKDEDLEETFASLLARLAEEDSLDDEDEDETSLLTKPGEAPKMTLPMVDSQLEDPESLVTPADGVQMAEDEEDGDGPEGEDEPRVTLPDVDSELESPEKLATPGLGPMAEDEEDGDDEKCSCGDPNCKGCEDGEDKDDEEEDDKKKEADVKEDINAIFAGTKLSEAAKAKAATIFQAAVTRRVNEEKTRVQKVATKKLKEAFAVLKTRSEKKQNMYESNLTGQVDRYLNYVVENWMGENRLAVEKGIRAELAESFISGLKELFVEHYIEVPESKVDVVATLGKKVSKLESKLNETVEQNIKMRQSLNTYRKEEVVRAVSNGLAETQREKLKGLAEGVEYTTRKEFAEKVMGLREAYFSKRATPVVNNEQPLLEATQKPVNNEMAVYKQTLSKMKKD